MKCVLIYWDLISLRIYVYKYSLVKHWKYQHIVPTRARWSKHIQSVRLSYHSTVILKLLWHPSGCLSLTYVFTDQPLTLAIFCRVHSTSQIRCSPNLKQYTNKTRRTWRTFICKCCSTRISRALATCSSTPNPGHQELSNINNKKMQAKDIWIPACPVSTTLYN